VLAQATAIVIVDTSIEQRSTYFVQMGVKVMDALHLAAAEAAQADYFCTCDDRFLRKAKRISGLQTIVVSPLELIEAIDA
jgi:predicted nucleic acid-binding protein